MIILIMGAGMVRCLWLPGQSPWKPSVFVSIVVQRP